MSKLQGALKMFMLGMLKTILKTMLKYEKRPSHFTKHVETEWQISFFSFSFARVTEVRHIKLTNIFIVKSALFFQKQCFIFLKKCFILLFIFTKLFTVHMVRLQWIIVCGIVHQ